MNEIMVIVIGLVLLGGSVDAQDNNSNSAAYHAIHNPQSPYYQGPGKPPAAPQAPRPTGYWQKTWGAIAPSGLDAVLGTAVGAKSRKEAEQLALADCKAKGGAGCGIQLAYHNQCGVMAIGSKRLFTASAGTVEEARAYGIELCERKDINCSIFYSACTEPIFHSY